MSVKQFSFAGENNHNISACKWRSDQHDPKAVIIINHGMAEHIRRYDEFARFLSEDGFVVYGEDHRGHGDTAGSAEDYGYFSDSRGWLNVIGDIRCLYLLAVKENPGLPVFMLGHSMGSFLTRHYISLYGSELKGAILLGTGHHSRFILRLAKSLAVLESRIKGRRHISSLLDFLTFGSYNKAYKSKESTGFEWLSRDRESVQKYVDDPACGFISRSGFYSDFVDGLKIIREMDCFRFTPDDLPLLLLSGSSDPVGSHGKGVKEVAKRFKISGTEQLDLHLIKEGRHECLHELDRQDHYLTIKDWLTARLAG